MLSPTVEPTSGPWSSPGLYCIALPLMLMVLTLGVIGGIALFRARREDVPRVLTIFTAAFSKLADRLPAEAGLSDDGGRGSGSDGGQAK